MEYLVRMIFERSSGPRANDDMGRSLQWCVLIATDCLPEGITCKTALTAVLHYNLPWNPQTWNSRRVR